MWASGTATSPTAATAATWGAGTTGVLVFELPSSAADSDTLGAFAEDLVLPPLPPPLPPLRPARLRSVAPRGRDPRLLRHAMARMRRAA
jgi:hypothetical protein